MKSLVIFGAQNDLVSSISNIDYADSCYELRSLVKNKHFDKIFYYEIDIYDPNLILTDRHKHRLCQADKPGAAINWRATEIGSELELTKISNIKSIHCTLDAETWMEMPYVSDFDTGGELYLAGNLALIAKSVARWQHKDNIKIIPEGIWLGSRDWRLILSFEYNGIEFYDDQSDNVRLYKEQYLKTYYSNLPLADLN